MQTVDDEYSEYLEQKYLPGRQLYLEKLFYPRIINELTDGPILDLGFGAGAFMKFASSKGYKISGIDSNPKFVEKAKSSGYEVYLGDLTDLDNVDDNIQNAIVDNVLEHLDESSIEKFLKIFSRKLSNTGKLIIIVPGEKGFTHDPTHETFVDYNLLNKICKKHDLKIEKFYRFPFNSHFISKVFYLNMQIMVVVK